MKLRYWWWFCLLAAACLMAGSEFLPGAEETKDSGQAAEAHEDPEGEQAALERLRTKEESFAGKIVVIPVKEDSLMVKARFEFMQRILERADDEGASAVILDMNTPGGYSWESGQMIMNYLPKMTIPTYTYVNPYAVSAGAIIALGTDTIYMAPTSAIGAALTVTGTGADLEETMAMKAKSISKAQVRSVAKRKGHNVNIAEGFVDDDVEVVIQVGGKEGEPFSGETRVLAKKGEVLSLDHEEATQLIGGKPLLAKGIAKDLEDLVAKEGLEGEIVVASPLGFEGLAEWVGRLSFLLIMFGIAGAYVEMQTPGFGVPGAVSILSFGLFFFGSYLAGKLAGFEVVAIFVLGLILIAAEVLLFPGTFFLGISGVIMVLGTLLYTMAGSLPEGGGDFSIDTGALGTAVLNLVVGLAGAVLLVLLLLRYLPETRAMSWLILKAALPEGSAVNLAGADVGGAGGSSIADLVGATGVAVTTLRPSGKGRFGDRILDVVSDGDFIDAGAEVKVVACDGGKVTVARV